MSASKWPRIKWNQANTRLANKPFENLFVEQERMMSALDDLMQKDNNQTTDLEFAVIVLREIRPQEAEKAAAELAQLRAELQAAQERIAELTQDDRYCPLCTWRGPVELVNGVCPQCDVDWPKAYREHRDALTVAQERSAEQARQLEAARNIINDYRNLPIGPKGYTSMPLFDLHNAADAWLAANPAPQEPQP